MNKLFDLTGKTALVTGSSSGMGKAIALAMASHGAQVIISSFDKQELENTRQQFENLGLKVYAHICDMSKTNQINELVETCFLRYSKIDILVNGVGIAPSGGFLEINQNSFEKTLALNLQSAIHITNLIIPKMQAQKDGVIIYLASIAGVRGNKTLGLYGISKAGLIQMAKNLAVEFGPENIRVNTISPGIINTPFSNSLLENVEFMKKRLLQTPLRRVGEVDEIAGVAVMLASKAGGFITGQNIIVDGGTTISDGN
ncbi:MAG: SDR family NAD(P)-dependent oxidoreductase [Emticicia sp.]|uniref:SDR family NAD(P)-dependent oxidoreductase n=1 Tax=Emticicia sp. TaxID=1930953 RepID=UPI003BA573EF